MNYSVKSGMQKRFSSSLVVIALTLFGFVASFFLPASIFTPAFAAALEEKAITIEEVSSTEQNSGATFEYNMVFNCDSARETACVPLKIDIPLLLELPEGAIPSAQQILSSFKVHAEAKDDSIVLDSSIYDPELGVLSIESSQGLAIGTQAVVSVYIETVSGITPHGTKLTLTPTASVGETAFVSSESPEALITSSLDNRFAASLENNDLSEDRASTINVALSRVGTSAWLTDLGFISNTQASGIEGLSNWSIKALLPNSVAYVSSSYGEYSEVERAVNWSFDSTNEIYTIYEFADKLELSIVDEQNVSNDTVILEFVGTSVSGEALHESIPLELTDYGFIAMEPEGSVEVVPEVSEEPQESGAPAPTASESPLPTSTATPTPTATVSPSESPEALQAMRANNSVLIEAGFLDGDGIVDPNPVFEVGETKEITFRVFNNTSEDLLDPNFSLTALSGNASVGELVCNFKNTSEEPDARNFIPAGESAECIGPLTLSGSHDVLRTLVAFSALGNTSGEAFLSEVEFEASTAFVMPTLPSTGGQGKDFYIIAAISLLVLASGVMFFSRKKKVISSES